MIYKENGPNPENKSAWPLHDCIKIKTSGGSQNGAEQMEPQLYWWDADHSYMRSNAWDRKEPWHEGYMKSSPHRSTSFSFQWDQFWSQPWCPSLHKLPLQGAVLKLRCWKEGPLLGAFSLFTQPLKGKRQNSPSIPALGGQKQVNLCDFHLDLEAILIYTMSPPMGMHNETCWGLQGAGWMEVLHRQCWSFNWPTEQKRYICRGSIYWVLQITKLTPLVFQSLNTQIHHLGTKVSTESKLHCFRGQRDGSAVRITSCSSRGTKFDSQHPFRAAHNCLSLQLQENWCPLLDSTSLCAHLHIPTPIQTCEQII